MIKIANPFSYPLAILVGGIFLIVGVRFLKLPYLITFPTAAIIATTGSTILKSQEPDEQTLLKQQLERELTPIKNDAKELATLAEQLRQEANLLLQDNNYPLTMLSEVQYCCDSAIELPLKIDRLTQQWSNPNSLLSTSKIQEQLERVNRQKENSNGIVLQQLTQLSQSLERNLQLAQQGKDTHTAQITNLQVIIQNTAGVLQQLQNRLRTVNFNDSQQVQELQDLTSQLNNAKTSFDILTSG